MLATVIALAAATSPIIQRNRFVVDKSYPAESALRGEQGNVVFRIRTNRKGQVDGCQVIESSGYRRLDEATCDMILRGATAKPLQDVNGWRVAGTRDAYVEWRLPVQFAMGSTPAFDTQPGRPGTGNQLPSPASRRFDHHRTEDLRHRPAVESADRLCPGRSDGLSAPRWSKRRFLIATLTLT